MLDSTKLLRIRYPNMWSPGVLAHLAGATFEDHVNLSLPENEASEMFLMACNLSIVFVVVCRRLLPFQLEQLSRIM